MDLKFILWVFNDVFSVLPPFCFLLTGMYHVFLLIKDGFFHITNLALGKIETGSKIAYAVNLMFCWSHCVDRVKYSLFCFLCNHSH